MKSSEFNLTTSVSQLSQTSCQFVGQHQAIALQPIVQLTMASPVGLLLLKANTLGLSHLTRVEHALPEEITLKGIDIDISSADREAASQHLVQARMQLLAYFAGQLTQFSVTLAPKGTLFQRQVWQALVELPFGDVCSYADIANRIARPKAVRAVGAANGANPIAIIVPCHRVIGKNGSLTGYAYGLTMKQQLLDLESQPFSCT